SGRKGHRLNYYSQKEMLRGRRLNRLEISHQEKQVRQQCGNRSLFQIPNFKVDDGRSQGSDSGEHHRREESPRTCQQAWAQVVPAGMRRVAEKDRATNEAEDFHDTL